MSRILVYPLFTFLLVLLWMMLTRFSLGHFILGSAIALLAGKAVEALQPETPRFRGWRVIPRLVSIFFVDIIRSNIAVTRQILTEGRSGRESKFIEVPLTLQSRTALSCLAIILTATPGTAWLEYIRETETLTLHIFDASEHERYLDMICNTYEPLLKELFE